MVKSILMRFGPHEGIAGSLTSHFLRQLTRETDRDNIYCGYGKACLSVASLDPRGLRYPARRFSIRNHAIILETGKYEPTMIACKCPATIMGGAKHGMLLYKLAKTCDAFGTMAAPHGEGDPNKKRKERPRGNLRRLRTCPESLVFIAQKPWINFPLVLGCDAMTIQPREASWSTKDVSEIPRPSPV